jgi:prevent-host-death family protein
MRTVGVLEAKTRLSELVAQAAAGESVTITRHGKPVAMLVPVVQRGAERQKRIEAAVAGLQALRRRYPLRGLRVKDLVDEGRKR